MSKHVFIIDDDRDLREIMGHALEDEGFRVTTFGDPSEVLRKLSGGLERPGFILTDYLMPTMNGVEFLKKLRTEFSEEFREVPLALSSAAGEIEGSLPPGIFQIPKPMDLDHFLNTVRNHCL